MSAFLLLVPLLAPAALREGGPEGVAHPQPGVYLYDADGNGKPDRFELDWSRNGAKHGYNVDLTLVDDRGEVLLEDGFFIAEREYPDLFDLAQGERTPKPADYFSNFLSLGSGPNGVEFRDLDAAEARDVAFTCLGDRAPDAAAAERARSVLSRGRHAVLTYARSTRDDGWALVYARPVDRLVCLPEADE